MNELINTNLTISSREIAKLTGKRHDHVIRDIEAITEELGQTPNLGADYNISKSTYQSGTGKPYNMYVLDKSASLLLITGYSVKHRAILISRWQELEKKVRDQDNRRVAPPSNLNTDAYLESAKIMKATSEVLKDFINDKNQLAISSSQVGYQATGVDIVKASGLQLIASTQKQLLTPSQIGKQMQPSMGGQKVNVLLEDKGFQLKSTDDKGKCVWLITEKGEAFGIYQDTGKRRSCGAPVRQFKWYSSVIDELEALEVAL